MDRLLTGRMCFASISLGLAKLSIAAAVKYSENRRGFGLEPESPFVVMSYGSQMRSLIPRLAQVFAMQAGLGTCGDSRLFPANPKLSALSCCELAVVGCLGLWADYCASQFRECFGTDDESLGTVVCAVKSYVTWTTTEIVNECRERMGAQGLLSRNQVAPALPEAHACITGEGDNNLLCQKTCRDLVVQFGTWLALLWLPLASHGFGAATGPILHAFSIALSAGADMKRRGWFRVVAEMSCGHVRLG
jgi:acyl-CoA oxidase